MFEARRTSQFRGGDDLFRNEAGAVVQAATNANRMERSSLRGLERFQNRGLISMADGAAGDRFTIANVPGAANANFSGGAGSTLAVDAELGGPGSIADVLVIDGNISGTTELAVTNVISGAGVFNAAGILIATVAGRTANPVTIELDADGAVTTANNNALFLPESIDTGFFNYDLYFVPTGSGFWELRSFAGPGAYLLPQLVTAAQDIWHQTSSTWFDRTADLRVLLAGGAAPTAYDPGGKDLSAAGPYPLTPAVWARGSGGWLDRDGTQRATAYGRDYTFNMDRELDTLDFQAGIDFGKRDFWSQGDALVFGLLGGFVHGDLDYDALARNFNFDGGQVGAYATYLNGGLFVGYAAQRPSLFAGDRG